MKRKTLQFTRTFHTPPEGTVGPAEELLTASGRETWELDLSAPGTVKGRLAYVGEDDLPHEDDLEAGYNIFTTGTRQSAVRIALGTLPGGQSVKVKVYRLS